MDNYKKSKRGVVSVIYSSQRTRSRVLLNPYPSYTFIELLNWCLSQDLFHELYNDWVDFGYKKGMKPSVDRKNDYEWYSMENIQLMSWADNNRKAYSDRKNGINNKLNKSVDQFTIDNIFIKTHYSMRDAERKTNISVGNIWACCNDIKKSTNNLIFKYNGTS